MKTFVKDFRVMLLPLFILLAQTLCFGQRSDRQITAEEKKQVVEKTFSLLKINYIFPAVIPAMEKEVYRKLTTGEYAAVNTAEDFIRAINKDLEALSKDKHVNIFFDPVRVKQIRAEENNSGEKPGYAPAFVQRAKYENYMVRKAERMDGNVGYLKFNSFVDTALSKKTLVAAMDFVANSNALIIDLRQNGGGDARTCTFLLSYFFPDSTLVMERRSRTEKTEKIYTAKDPSISRLDKIMPVYILTSNRTSSAAEAFAYSLQSYKRATIIGDTTKGEANPGYLYALNDEFYLMIPAFENINPITKTNWQGKGVYPDHAVMPDKSLMLAQVKAYEKLEEIIPVDELKGMYNWMATGLLSELNPITLNEKELKPMEGDYADTRHILYENNSLYYYRGSDRTAKRKLVPMNNELFALEGTPYFRIRFIKDQKGKVTALEGIYDDGKKEISEKLLGASK